MLTNNEDDEDAFDETLIPVESVDINVRRRPFVSRFKRTLDLISTDSTESRKHHPVRKGGSASSEQRSSDVVWYEQLRRKLEKEWSQVGSDGWLSALLPCWTWLQHYKFKETFPSDLVAGLTVGMMVVPQSMSYAKLAGLPVEFGLYSALLPIYAYALFGSSRQLAVGPVAIVSLLLNTGLTGLLGDPPESNKSDSSYQLAYNQLAIQCSFLVGVSYILMGVCRLGFVTIFMSHAVVSGFTTGASIIIGMSQVKYLFGYNIPQAAKLQEILKYLFQSIDQFDWRPFIMGTSSILLLVLFKNIGKTYPKLKWMRAAGPLIVTIIAIVLTVSIDLANKGIKVVGHIPSGFPNATVDQWTPITGFDKLFKVVVSIAIVGFMESIAIAKQLASKHSYEIDSNKELMGLGVANFLGSAFSAYPVTGSFSRSAVNNESGAKSGVAGVVTATVVCVALLFLTPVFEQLPLNTLAAIVISGVLGLLDYEEAIYLWKVHKIDFTVWLLAFVGCLFAGVETGLEIAVVVSLLIVIYESAYPQTSVLGRLPGTTAYRNVKQYPDAEIYDGIVVVRIDAPLYFANAQNVREKIRKYRREAEAEMARRNGEVKYVVLDLSPVSHIDTTALHQLEYMVENHRERGQELVFSNPSLRVMERLVASGLADTIGTNLFFASLHDAVNYCLHELDSVAVSVHDGMANGNYKQDEEVALRRVPSRLCPNRPKCFLEIGNHSVPFPVRLCPNHRK